MLSVTAWLNSVTQQDKTNYKEQQIRNDKAFTIL